MVETITPVVHGGRGRWAAALVVHAVGATLTAVAFGAVLGWTGSLLGAPFGASALLTVAALAVVYALGALGVVKVPVPALRRQVPDWWRTFYPPMITAFLYGAGLGIGFFTFLATGALIAVSAAAFLSGSAVTGAALVGAFGLARGLSPVIGVRVRTVEDGRALVDRLASRAPRTRSLAAAASLVLVAMAAAGAAPSATGGDPAALASAVVAVTFLWAGIAKLAAPARWRRALVSHDLPAALQRRAIRGVPVAELGVPALALLGATRAAAWWALALLAVFAAAVARRRILGSRTMACGCFGGHVERSAPVLLGRIGVLAVLAALASTASGGGLLVQPPGVPGPTEVLPAALAVGGSVAVLALWSQASRWLGVRS